LSSIPLSCVGKLGFAATADEIAAAAANADFIQESAPENEEVKIKILAAIEEAAREDAVIASSTSGLLPSRLQAGMKHPRRFCVGHPFNPVYLLPLAEVCGGKQTAPQTLQAAADFYSALGMRPLIVRREIDGFIADRLMEALWREALWLVHDDIATTGEIDDAIRYGCGLRWAFMGVFMTYRLGGGEGGMRHFLSQFGPALKLPWTKLMNTPELSPELIEKIAAQSDAQANGQTIARLEEARDDAVVAVLQALRGQNIAAGALLRDYEETLFQRAHARAASEAIDAPLRLHRGQVPGEWLDYNGHVNESRYLQIFSNATDDALGVVGASADYLRAGYSFFTAETHIIHHAQMRAGDDFFVTTQILAADEKRVHFFHELFGGEQTDAPLASAEQMLLHVNLKSGRVCEMRDDVKARAIAAAAAHRHLPLPPLAGRKVGMKPGA
jgi:carnitine 3-dehydrogenase